MDGGMNGARKASRNRQRGWIGAKLARMGGMPLEGIRVESWSWALTRRSQAFGYVTSVFELTAHIRRLCGCDGGRRDRRIGKAGFRFWV
jgi:hypothetical protein